MEDTPSFEFGKKGNDNQLDFQTEISKYARVEPIQKQKEEAKTTVKQASGEIGPSKPANYDDDDTSSSDDEPDINNPFYVPKKKDVPQVPEKELAKTIPCSHDVLIRGHTRGVTTIDVDPKGYRMISGANDYKARLWDFQGMNKSMNSFRILEPYEGQPINRVHFSPDGAEVLVCTMASQARVYDRDGREVAETIKGDMYLTDLSNTRGHTSMIRDGQWNPVEQGIFMTCSLDSTVRIWDVNAKKVGIEQQIPHKTIIKCKNNQGKRIGCTACCYTSDGRTIAVNCTDGSLHIYSARSYFSRAEGLVLNAHTPENTATSMCFFKDGTKLVTRANDHTMKIWDLRKFKMPLHECKKLENTDIHTQVSLSPDEKYILTGTSITKQDQYGLVVLYDSVTFERVGQLTISEASVTSCIWHPVLNQIFVGSADHNIHVLCDPSKSQRGALLCLTKAERKPRPEDIDYTPDIRTPHALPAFKDENKNRKKQIEKLRQNTILSKKPEFPTTGPNKAGASGPGTVTQYIMLSQHKNETHKEDAREALIKLDAETRKSGDLVLSAYAKTQPVPIFDYTSPQVEEQELLSSIKKICPGCGLKICRCGLSLRPYSNTRSMFSQGDN